VPSARTQLISRLMKPVLDHRVGKTKWVVLRWPTSAMAQQAGMSTEAFEDFYLQGLQPRLLPADAGHEGACRPDGEDRPRAPQGTRHRPHVFDQGHRRPTLRRFAQHPGRRGLLVPGEGLRRRRDPIQRADGLSRHLVRQYPARLQKGRIVEATANNTKRLNEILDSDAGARYIGEFAIGFNPAHPRADAGHSLRREDRGLVPLHPGQAYDGVGNGNKSQVHWDMVNIQRPEYGGGEIWFDGKLIRKARHLCAEGVEQTES